MSQFFSFRFYIGAMLLLFYANLCADTLRPTTLIDNGGNPFGAPPYSSFNTQTNKFFVGWISGNLSYSLYSTSGSLLSGPTIVVSDSGPVIPFTPPISCYNSTNNEFLISYLGLGDGIHAWFNILDQDGNSIVGPTPLENVSGDEANSLVFCCYNTRNNEYLLTWGSIGNLGYFTIINAEGNIVVPTTAISGANVPSSATSNVFVSYNSTDNQYLFTWGGIDEHPYYALYNADGTQEGSTTQISNIITTYPIAVTSTYNSVDNQYFITWFDINANGYFVIYTAAGIPVGPITSFSNQISTSGNNYVSSSYNSQNNEYFLTWAGVDGNSQYEIFDALGAVVIEATSIPNFAGVTDFGFVTNSYSRNANAFFIAWIGPESITDGYYAIYARTSLVNPPTQGNGQHILNRFANYGEYFNSLQWHLSTSSNVASYKMYRNGSLIATLPPFQTTYEQHNQPNIPILYSVTAVNVNGAESIPLYIQV